MSSPFGGNWKDLVLSCAKGDLGSIRYHMENGVDPNYQHPEFFTAPIFEAIRYGQIEAVKLLLQYDVTELWLMEDSSDCIPIEVAMEEKQHEMVDILLNHMEKKTEPGNKDRPSGDNFCKTTVISIKDEVLLRNTVTLLLQRGHRVHVVVVPNGKKTRGETTIDSSSRNAVSQFKYNNETGNTKLTIVDNMETNLIGEDDWVEAVVSEIDRPIHSFILDSVENEEIIAESSLARKEKDETNTQKTKRIAVTKKRFSPSSGSIGYYVGPVSVWERLTSGWKNTQLPQSLVWLSLDCVDAQPGDLYDCHKQQIDP